MIKDANTICDKEKMQKIKTTKDSKNTINPRSSGLMFQSKFPQFLWTYAIQYVAFIINRVPTLILQGKTPFELLYGTQPDLHDLRVFGSLCYASTLAANITKFQRRARKGAFLGYKGDVKGCILFDLHSREVFLSRDVEFHETIMPDSSPAAACHWHYISYETTAHPPTSSIRHAPL